MPDFSKSFYYENNFYLASDVNRMAKVMAHYELYKMSLDVPGAIVECGVFKGASFVRFATFRQLLSNPLAKKMMSNTRVVSLKSLLRTKRKPKP